MWSKVKHFSAILLGGLAILVFLVLVVVVLLGVFLRNGTEMVETYAWLGFLKPFFKGQPGWTSELATFLLVWISFLGGAIAYVDDKHLGIDLLVGGFDRGARRVSKVVSHGMVFVFSFAVMGVGGVQQVIDRWQAGQKLAEMGILVAWLYLAVPVSGFLISLFALGNVVEHLAKRGVAEVGNREGAQ